MGPLSKGPISRESGIMNSNEKRTTSYGNLIDARSSISVASSQQRSSYMAKSKMQSVYNKQTVNHPRKLQISQSGGAKQRKQIHHGSVENLSHYGTTGQRQQGRSLKSENSEFEFDRASLISSNNATRRTATALLQKRQLLISRKNGQSLTKKKLDKAFAEK